MHGHMNVKFDWLQICTLWKASKQIDLTMLVSSWSLWDVLLLFEYIQDVLIKETEKIR
jgi:hypothetical protein